MKTKVFGQEYDLAQRWGDGHDFEVLGNGRMILTEENGRIKVLCGPEYSGPTFVVDDEVHVGGKLVEFDRERILGTAIWIHSAKNLDGSAFRTIDLVDWDSPVFYRFFLAEGGDVDFTDTFVIGDGMNVTIQEVAGTSAVLITAPVGTRLFGLGYTIPREFVCLIAPHFSEADGASEGKLDVQVKDGKVVVSGKAGQGPLVLSFVTGWSKEDVLNLYRGNKVFPSEFILSHNVKTWQDWSGKVTYPDGCPDKLARLIESVSVFIKVQQSRDGGIMAGHIYPMAYLRDQYGTMRGMLAMGMLDEAKMVLKYLNHKLRRFGRIHNADDMGLDSIIHVHEHDNAEILGYAMLMVRDYIKKSGDKEFLRELYPFLRWCFYSQYEFSKDGLLPFNGDETYRWVLWHLDAFDVEDYSFDSSMLFVTSGRFLQDVAVSLGFESEAEAISQIIAEVQENVENAFWRGDHYVSNNMNWDPKDLESVRPGVCEACLVFTLCKKAANNHFLCDACLEKYPDVQIKTVKRERVITPVSLRPLWVDYLKPEDERAQKNLEYVLGNFRMETGLLATNDKAQNLTGHTMGFLLDNLTKVGADKAQEVFDMMFDLVTPHGMFTEYYTRDGESYGCRMRAWESGVNVAAMIDFVNSKRNC